MRCGYVAFSASGHLGDLDRKRDVEMDRLASCAARIETGSKLHGQSMFPLPWPRLISPFHECQGIVSIILGKTIMCAGMRR